VQKHRYKVSFSLTALLYIIPVATYLYFLQQHMYSQSEPQENAIELSLSQFVPEAPPVQCEAPVQEEQLVEEEQEEVEEETKKIETPEPEPEPEKVEPEPEPEPEPEKVEPLLKETPVEKPQVEKKEKPIKPKKVQKKKKTQKKKQKRVHHKRQIKGGGSPRYSAAQKNRFLASIRKKINQAKSYPRVAQKRGFQGVIRAQFTILPNGNVCKIRLSGPRIFYKSAKKAIECAFPVDARKAPLKLPAVINLSLRYKLR